MLPLLSRHNLSPRLSSRSHLTFSIHLSLFQMSPSLPCTKYNRHKVDYHWLDSIHISIPIVRQLALLSRTNHLSCLTINCGSSTHLLRQLLLRTAQSEHKPCKLSKDKSPSLHSLVKHPSSEIATQTTP